MIPDDHKGARVNMAKVAKLTRVGAWTVEAHDGSEAATVEIPTQFSRRAVVTLRQAAFTTPELRRLVRALTRAAEKLDG